jgi:hypothetical protein
MSFALVLVPMTTKAVDETGHRLQSERGNEDYSRHNVLCKNIGRGQGDLVGDMLSPH